jgi:hypothetical protein
MIVVRRNIPIVKIVSYFGLGTVERLRTNFSQFDAKYWYCLAFESKVTSVFRNVGSDTKGQNVTWTLIGTVLIKRIVDILI